MAFSTNNPHVVAVRFQKSVSRVMNRLALDITEGLIETTPVDTGWARSNWVPSVGAPNEDTVGSKEDVSTDAQGRGTAAIFANLAAGGLDPLFITNHVPYIEKLNDGYSPQAPAGFVDAIVAGAVENARSRGDIE